MTRRRGRDAHRPRGERSVRIGRRGRTRDAAGALIAVAAGALLLVTGVVALILSAVAREADVRSSTTIVAVESVGQATSRVDPETGEIEVFGRGGRGAEEDLPAWVRESIHAQLLTLALQTGVEPQELRIIADATGSWSLTNPRAASAMLRGSWRVDLAVLPALAGGTLLVTGLFLFAWRHMEAASRMGRSAGAHGPPSGV